MGGRLRFWLKVSRPGLWFPTIWLYLMPLAGRPLGEGAAFWAGLFFVTFPLNFWVYGWNDRVDRETDRQNPRKDSWLFGARGTDAELDTLPRAMGAVVGLSVAGLTALGGPGVLGIAAAIAAFLWAYNHETAGLRGRPPGDLLCQVGYLLTVALSCVLNGVPAPDPAVWAYLALFCAQAQLVGEVMDIAPDRAAGRRTTATVLGSGTTRLVLIGVVAAEVLLLGLVFGDWIFAGGLAAFWLWLVVDRFVLFPSGQYTVGQMKALGLGGNVAALASMVYVQWSGLFGTAP